MANVPPWTPPLTPLLGSSIMAPVFAAPASTSKTRTPTRFALVCAIVVRMVAVLLAGELAGVGHIAADVYASMRGIEGQHAADCGDEEGHECPPGCPDCHAWRGSTAPQAVLQPVPESVLLHRLVTKTQQGAPYEASALSSADPDSLYRPPRFCAFV